MTNAPESMTLKHWLLLVCGTLLYALVCLQRVAVPGAVFDELQSAWALSSAQTAALGSVFLYLYAFLQPVSGPLLDRFGGARMIFWSVICFCAGSLLFAVAPTLPLLYAARALTGIGSGAMYLSLAKLLDRYFPRHFSMMLGALLFIGYGGGAGVGLVSRCAALHSWRIAFGGIAGIATVLAFCYVLCYCRIPKPPVQSCLFHVRPFRKVLTRDHTFAAIVAGAMPFVIYYSLLLVVCKKFLEDVCHVAPSTTDLLLSGMVLLSAAMNFFSGTLSYLLGNRRKPCIYFMTGSCVAAGIVLIWGTLSGAPGWLAAGAFIVFAVAAGFQTVGISLVRELAPRSLVGTATSAMEFFSYLLVAVMVSLTGFLLEWFGGNGIVRTGEKVLYPLKSYVGVFSVMLVFFLLALWLSFLPRETKGRPCTDEV